MGFLSKKNSDSAMRGVEVTIGTWLADAAATTPWSMGELMAGATRRVRFDELLGSTTTYIGPDGKVSLSEEAMMSVPTCVRVAAIDTNIVEIRCGATGFLGGKTMSVSQRTDWVATLRIADNSESATVAISDARTSGGSMANESVYRKVLDALADVASQGVAITSDPVAGAADIDRLLELADVASTDSLELPSPTTISIHPADISEAIVEFVDMVDKFTQRIIPSSRIDELRGGGQWPVANVTDGGGLVLRTGTYLSRRIVGAMLRRYAIIANREGSPEWILTRRIVDSLKGAAGVHEWRPEPHSAPSLLASKARHLPHALSGTSSVGTRLFFDVLVTCLPTRSTSQTFGKWKFEKSIRQPVRWAVDPVLGYAYGGALTFETDVLGDSLGLEASSGICPVSDDKRSDGRFPGHAVVSALSFSGNEALDHSRGVVELLRNAADAFVEHDGEPVLHRIDRHRPWGASP